MARSWKHWQITFFSRESQYSQRVKRCLGLYTVIRLRGVVMSPHIHQPFSPLAPIVWTDILLNILQDKTSRVYSWHVHSARGCTTSPRTDKTPHMFTIACRWGSVSSCLRVLRYRANCYTRRKSRPGGNTYQISNCSYSFEGTPDSEPNVSLRSAISKA